MAAATPFRNGSAHNGASPGLIRSHESEPIEPPGGPIRPAEIQWMWTAEEFDEWTPSRAVGVDVETERMNRYTAVKFIYQMSERLTLWGHVMHSASVYLHRFFLRKPMRSKLPDHAGYDHFEVAAACLFMASKNEEQNRKLGQVIDAAIVTMNYISGGKSPLGVSSPENFRRWRDTIIAFEDELFPCLCGDLDVGQPEAMYIEACQIFDVEREQVYSGVSMLHDINRDVYCQLQEANVQAAAAFYLIHLMADIDWRTYTLPEELEEDIDDSVSGDEKLWRAVFFCDLEDVQACIANIRNFYIWRKDSVSKTMSEIEAEQARRAHHLRRIQRRAGNGEPVSPRRPGLSTAGDHLQSPDNPESRSADTGSHQHASSPLHRPNGSRSHPHQHQQLHHLQHSAMYGSSSSSAYTPELATGEADGHSSSFAAQQQQPNPHAHTSSQPHSSQEGERRAAHSSQEAGSSSHYRDGRGPWKSGHSSRYGGEEERHRQQSEHSGRHGAPGGLLSPEMPDEDDVAPPAQSGAYAPASPMLEDEQADEGLDRPPEPALPSSTPAAGADRWRTSSHGAQPSSQSQFQAPLSPEMPGEDDEEGAVNGDI